MFGMNKIEKTREEQKADANVERAEDKLERLENKIEDLKDQRDRVKENLVEVNHKHKMKTEDLEHLIALKEERLQLEFDQKLVTKDKEHADALAVTQENYRDKIEENLEKERVSMKDMFKDILNRLPDVTAHFGTAKEKTEIVK